ncbi:BRO1-like domain-containing protein [Infundibulicybe gibba]|nr:BRO1-like domain-containing protein [Infundibulicybe gibba]
MLMKITQTQIYYGFSNLMHTRTEQHRIAVRLAGPPTLAAAPLSASSRITERPFSALFHEKWNQEVEYLFAGLRDWDRRAQAWGTKLLYGTAEHSRPGKANIALAIVLVVPMAQSPMISIPKKTTDDVDWTTPIRTLISQSYGENPDNYAAECASLQRCRQDAVRGAGSDMTARDLLYKYFGQLELLELRFSEIRVSFPWHDAFTNKLVTQTSIAYEKASILFQIAATHSAIAAAQNRSDPEGLKRAFYYLRTCAGMLNYINENFLHAPSTDLAAMLSSTEVFFEKCIDEKKGNALVSKIASQAAAMYTSLTEDVKEFMGKGIFDRNWVNLIQIKAKHFSSLAQYYRGIADNAAGKHGEALVRLTLAESLEKEAQRAVPTFVSTFVSTLSPTLPADASNSILDRIKTHLALCSERRAEAHRENDLIYNAVLPAPEALPTIEKTNVATAVHIHDVYAAPDVQKTIGQDFFIRLVPLSVHESASVYSEEKAKLVRGEVERAESAEGEARSAIDGLGVKEGLARFRAMAEGAVGGEEVPMEVRRWVDDITLVEDRESVDSIMAELGRLKTRVRGELDAVSRDLEIESKDCEVMRMRYAHLWTQEPSATLSRTLRQDLKSHLGALDAAAASDQQVTLLWDSVRGDIKLLLSPELEDIFKASAETSGASAVDLLDLDLGADDESKERAKIRGYVEEIEERLGRINKISLERNEVLKDLKDKIQSDDVSHLLLLNRRNNSVEPTLFAAELEKFRPHQQRLASTVHHQQTTLQEVSTLWRGLRDLAGRGPGARRWDEREKKKRDTVRRFAAAREGYMEVRDGLAKGLQFYTELTELTKTLRVNVKSFVTNRATEREALAGRLEAEKRLSAPPPLPPPPPQGRQDLDAYFAAMSVNNRNSAPTSPPPPPAHEYHPRPTYQPQPPRQQPQLQQSYNIPAQYPPPPPTPPTHQSQRPNHQQQSSFSLPPLPPPPPPRAMSMSTQSDPYANLGLFNPSSPAGGYAASPQPPQQNQQQQFGSGFPLPPPPPPPGANMPSYPGQGYGGYGR